jgi:hypothetical protein
LDRLCALCARKGTGARGACGQWQGGQRRSHRTGLSSARVVAEGEVEAFCITRPNFERLLHLNDRMVLKIHRFFVQTLAKRLRTTSESLAKAAARA